MDEQNGTGHIKMAEQKLSCIIHTGISIPNSFIAFIPADFVGRGTIHTTFPGHSVHGRFVYVLIPCYGEQLNP